MKPVKSTLVLLLMLFYTNSIFSSENNDGKEKEYPVTILEQNAEFVYEGTNLQKYTFHQKYRINNQQGADSWNYTSSSWSPWYQKKPVITAKVTNTDGKVYELDQDTVVEVATRSQSRDIYSDQKKIKAPLPSIGVGSIVEEKIQRESIKPFFNGGYDRGYDVQEQNPVKKLTITIDVEEDVDLIFKSYLFDFNPKITSINGRKIYKLEFKDQEALENKPILAGKDYNHWPSLFWTTAKSWKSVVKEYYNLIEPKIEDDSEVDNFIKSIDLTGSDEEKITNILMHMHNEIRYTGLELGESSIIPHTPNETISRKYGDCKDKAVLLHAILKRIGIKSNIALLKAGFGQDVPENIPGLRQFNHAILYLPKPYDVWIDATSQFSRFGEVPSSCAGRNSLIISPKTKELVKLPPQLSSDNVRDLTHHVYMSSLGKSKVVEELKSTGYFGRNRRSFFHSIPQDELDEKITSYVKSSFESEEYDNLKYLPGTDLRENFFLEFSIPETKFGYTNSDESGTSLYLTKVFGSLPDSITDLREFEDNTGEKEDSEWYEREIPVVLGFPFISRHTYAVYFPEGFVINELPSDESHSFGDSKYKVSFKKDGNKVIVGTEFDTGDGVFTPEELTELRQFLFRSYSQAPQKITASSFKSMFIKNDEFKESVNYYRDKIREEPKDFSHKVRLADTFIEAGFAKTGQKYLEDALKINNENIETHMAYAFSNLYDEWGRSDISGDKAKRAISEYKKIIEKDPETINAWQNIAIISEYDTDGYRYNKGANLEEALKYYDKYIEYSNQNNMDFNILLDLFVLRDFKSIMSKEDMVRKINTYNAWGIYFAANLEVNGFDKAYKEIFSLTSSADERRKIIEITVGRLKELRKYKLAADLLGKIDKSVEKYIEIENEIKFLNSLGYYEDIKFDDSKPEGVVKRYWYTVFVQDKVADKDIEKLFAKKLRDHEDEILGNILDVKEGFIHNSLNDNSNLDALRDVLCTSLEFDTEQAGEIYRLKCTLNFPKEQVTQTFYVHKEDGRFKLLHSDGKVPWLIAETIKESLAKGDKVQAVRLLNWLTEDISRGEYYSILRSVWKSNKRSDSWIKMGIASLIYLHEESTEYILKQEPIFRSNGMYDEYTYIVAMHYREKEMHEESYNAVRKYVDDEGLSSERAGVYLDVYLDAGKQKEFEVDVRKSLEFDPNNVNLHSLIASNYAIQGEYDKAVDYLLQYVNSNAEDAAVLNNLSWYGLYTNRNLEEMLEYSIKSNQVSKFSVNGRLHTLATLLAEVGKIKQSREILLHLIGRQKNEDLDVEYYIMGRNAETLGLLKEAKCYYNKIKKPESQILVSTYQLAQKRLEKL